MAQVPDHFAGSPPGGISRRVKIAGVLEGNDRGPGGDYRIEDMSAHKLLAQKHSRRENVRDKAKRLLVSGRLRIVKVDGDLIIAECRGDSGEVYKLGYRPDQKRWGCTCQARTACSHQHALWAVVALERS